MTNQTLDVRQILDLLPHRAPFLLVDRVVEYAEGEALTAVKNVTYNEPFFPGHFPGVPTMPGVLILEAMAQACGVLALLKSGVRADSGQLLYFAGIDQARFRRPVVPGDVLTLKCRLLQQKRDIWKFTAQALVGAELACDAELMCVVRKPPDANPPA